MFDYQNVKQIVPMLPAQAKLSELRKKTTALQRKWNGSMGIIIRNENVVIIMGRSWKTDFAPMYPELVEDILKMSPTQFVTVGEITFYYKGTEKDSFLTALAKPETRAEFDMRLNLFEVLHVAQYDVMDNPLSWRYKVLKLMVPEGLHYIRVGELIVGNVAVKAWYARGLLAYGAEGLVFKDIDSVFVEGEVVEKDGEKVARYVKGAGWGKYKPTKTADCVVIGCTVGTGVRSETFGALLLGQYDSKGFLHYVGKTSGFTDEMLLYFSGEIDEFTVEELLLANPDDLPRNLQSFCKPENVVEVKYARRTKKNKFIEPRFTRLRNDEKSPKECVMYER